jgi:hypothetical protein
VTGWRSAVLAELRVITRIVNGELVPLLRAEARMAETLARDTLPGNRAVFLRGFRVLSRRLWRDTEGIILGGMRASFVLADRHVADLTVQAIAARTDMDRLPDVLESELGQVLTRARAHAAQARHGHTLSRRVWLNERGTVRRVQAEVDRAVRAGESPAKLARRVRQHIQPNVPGGVSYAAMRLARTELLSAWDARERQALKTAGIYTGAEWMLSPTHASKPSSPDVCDRLRDGGPYTWAQLPARPHPHCMCYLEPVIDEDAVAALEREEAPRLAGPLTG